MQTTTYPNTTGKDAMKDFASSANPPPAETRIADVAAKAAKSAREIVEEGRKSVRELVDEGKTAAAQRFDATTEWVGATTRENPLRTLGIAAVVGIVVGLLIGRR
ncbi:MAG: DUF883 family protein [Burkholderiales bacterium]